MKNSNEKNIEGKSRLASPPPKPTVGRKVKLMTYCKGVDGAKSYGGEIGGMNLCDHPECDNCRNFEQLSKEEILKQLSELQDNIEKYKNQL